MKNIVTRITPSTGTMVGTLYLVRNLMNLTSLRTGTIPGKRFTAGPTRGGLN